MIQSETNLNKVLLDLQSENIPGLSLFISAGYPDMEQFKEILLFINHEKLADFIEIGIPFSDPIADGPLIQAASKTALENGSSIGSIFEMIESIKDDLEIPMVLMSYFNPVLVYGISKIFKVMKNLGFSAAIIPDLPVDEASDIIKEAEIVGLGIVFLAAPSTDDMRLERISSSTDPFLYYVSRFGITGIQQDLANDISEKLNEIKTIANVPVYCGFGISDAQQAAIVGKTADGVIIGSAITKLIISYPDTYLEEIKKFAINVKKQLSLCRKS